MHSLTGSEYPSRSSEAKLFGIEFSYLHVSKEDSSIEARCDQLDSQLFEAEYFADENSALVPANVAAIVDSSQLEPLRVLELRQLPRQSYRAGDVKTRGNLVVQTLMRALVVKHVAEVIEAALLCSKGCRRWFSRVLLQGAPSRCDASARGGRFVVADPPECAHARSQASSIRARALIALRALCPQTALRCRS